MHSLCELLATGSPGTLATPRSLTDAITDPDRAAAKRAFEAMMKTYQRQIVFLLIISVSNSWQGRAS